MLLAERPGVLESQYECKCIGRNYLINMTTMYPKPARTLKTMVHLIT